HHGHEVTSTGDGFFVGFESQEDAVACAVAIQQRLDAHRRENGFAPKVRIGVHLAEAQQVGDNFLGKGVHEAARIAALASGGEILVSKETGCGTSFRSSDPRSVELKGLSKPMDVVSITWQ